LYQCSGFVTFGTDLDPWLGITYGFGSTLPSSGFQDAEENKKIILFCLLLSGTVPIVGAFTSGLKGKFIKNHDAVEIKIKVFLFFFAFATYRFSNSDPVPFKYK
jgi:hypothetical protein